jgi:hypothetical protein
MTLSTPTKVGLINFTIEEESIVVFYQFYFYLVIEKSLHKYLAVSSYDLFMNLLHTAL